MYAVDLEQRIAPFGIIRRRKHIGQLSAGQPVIDHQLGNAHIAFSLDKYQILSIKSDQPAVVVFAAEPSRTWPKTVVKLDQDHPEIPTNRRGVTVFPENNPAERLILTAPKFQPRIVTLWEAIALSIRALDPKQ